MVVTFEENVEFLDSNGIEMEDVSIEDMSARVVGEDRLGMSEILRHHSSLKEPSLKDENNNLGRCFSCENVRNCEVQNCFSMADCLYVFFGCLMG